MRPAKHVVARIGAGLAEWNRAGHLERFELSLSIGVSEWSESKTLAGLLGTADNKMYAAKAEQKLSQGKAAGETLPIPTAKSTNCYISSSFVRCTSGCCISCKSFFTRLSP